MSVRSRTPGLLLLVAAAHGGVLGVPRRGEAATDVNGNSYVENTTTSRPGDASNLFQAGVNLDVVPSTKKKLKANLSTRLNYVRSDEDELTHVSPLGNLGLDLAGESFTLNVQQSRYATLGTTTELTETTLSRAALTLSPASLPRLSATAARTRSQTGSSPETMSDTGTLQADYQYRWLQARAGYTADRRESGASSNRSSSGVVGLLATTQILADTLLTAGVDLSRFDAESAAGARSSSVTTAYRANVDSHPLSWVGLAGNFSRSDHEFDAGTSRLPATTQRLAEATATVLPHPALRLGATVGNRRFDDIQAVRSVDFRILSASFSREIRERALMGATASRSFESDPGQGENVSDNVSWNAVADLTPRISLRVNASVNRTENRAFRSAQIFNASGTLAERDLLDRDSGGLPAGFIFFDTLNSDLYTKNSSAIGDWSLPSHVDLVKGSFAANRSLQVNAAPTDRMSLSLSYAANASSEDLGVLGRVGSQSLNGSLTYVATRRSNLGVTGVASLPEGAGTAYSASASYAYRFVRGHQLNLSYGRQLAAPRRSDAVTTRAAPRRTDSFSATLSLRLRKRTALEVTYLATQLLREEQNDYVRVRMGHTF